MLSGGVWFDEGGVGEEAGGGVGEDAKGGVDVDYGSDVFSVDCNFFPS